MPQRSKSELKKALLGFEPDPACPKPHCWGEHHIGLSDEELAALPPYAIFLAFVTFSGFPYRGRSEKIAWTIPVLFRDVPYVLEHQKFGFHVYPLSSSATPKLDQELIGQLKRAVHLVDDLIQPLANDQVKKGNVTFRNRQSMFRYMYTFLCNKATDAYAATPPPSEPICSADGHIVGWKSYPLQPEFDGFVLAASALDAYFSWLEHILVLLLPFAAFSVGRDDIIRFLALPWAAKFKRIFNLTTDRDAEKAFRCLNALRRSLRNPLYHGGIDEGARHILHFRMNDIGAIPLSVSRHRDSIHYSLVPIPSKSFKNICEMLDDVDEFLRGGVMRLGMKFAEADLNVAFDANSIAQYHSAMRSDEAMEELMEATTCANGEATNMD